MCEQRRFTVVGKGVSKRTGRRMRCGFTLVELLVVIAIIALLMSILMPALRRVKMQAQEVTCRSNLKQVGLILFMYLQENDFKMPCVYQHDWLTPGHSNNTANGYIWRDVLGGPILKVDAGPKTYWGTALKDFVKNTKVFGCPAFKNALEMMDFNKLYGADVKLFYDSAIAFNGYLDRVNVNAIRNQGEVIVGSDHVEPRIEQGHDNHNDMFCPGSGGQEPLSHYTIHDRTSWYRGIFRHNVRRGDIDRTGGRANVLWLDNTVSVIEEEDVFNNLIPQRYYDPVKDGHYIF